MSVNKTIYTTDCPFFSTDFCKAFCENPVLEIRTYKGHERGQKYAQGDCGIDIRPNKGIGNKILAQENLTNLHSAKITEKQQDLKQKPLEEQENAEIEKSQEKSLDYFEILGS
jgi:hypothetical protein